MKRKLSPEQIEAKAREKAEKAALRKTKSEIRKIATKVKKSCNAIGLRATQLQRDWLKSNTAATRLA